MTMFEVEGQRLDYRVLGEGAPVLWVNNIGLPPLDDAAYQTLLAAGHQVVVFDYQGPDDCTVQDVARRAGTLLDHLDTTAWVWGFSQGAWIAQELALLRPDRIDGAILTATRGRMSPFVRLQLRAQQQAAELGAGEAFVALSLSTLFDARTLHTEQLVDTLVGPMLENVFDDRERLLRSCRASLAYDDRTDALRDVAVPTLVIRFGDDLKCPPALGLEVAEAIPGAETLLIEHATHAALSTNAKDVFDAGLQFIERNSS